MDKKFLVIIKQLFSFKKDSKVLNSTLYSKGFVPLHASMASAGYQVYIKPEALEFLTSRIQDDHASFKMIKNIVNLRSNPRPLDGLQNRAAPNKHILPIGGILVSYYIESGCVCVTEVLHNPNAKKADELPGLHLVSKTAAGWNIIDYYINRVETKFAAVNGQSNSRTAAANDVMPFHLENAYNDESIKEFTLFHNPTVGFFGDTWESTRDKLGITNPMTKRFAKILEETQNYNGETKWVAHSQGGAIFTQAVNYLNKKKGITLDKQTIYFQAHANNMMMTKPILRNAGVKLHKDGYNNNPFDGVPQIIGLNAVTDLLLGFGFGSIGRLLAAPLAIIPGLLPFSFTGNTQISPHTRPYNGVGNYGKSVASGVKDILGNMVKRFV